jgi:hypothetical protein
VLKRLTMLALGLVAVAALVAGCGSDDDDASASSDKAAFVKEANALCAKERKKLEDEVYSYTPPYVKKNPDQRFPAAKGFPFAFRDVGLPGIERQTKALRELGASREDKKFDAYLAAVQNDIDEARRRPPKQGTEFLERFEGSGNLARAYGIGKCAYGY